MKNVKSVFVLGVMMALIVFMTSCDSKKKNDGKGDEKIAMVSDKGKDGIFEKAGEITVGAKNQYAQSASPIKFFDKDTATAWHSGEPGEFNWISISYIKPFKASKYKISRRVDISSQAPADFALEGAMSDKFPGDESQWQVIDEQKDQQWADLTHTYAINTLKVKDYKHYRLRIIKTVNMEQGYASIAEFELIE